MRGINLSQLINDLERALIELAANFRVTVDDGVQTGEGCSFDVVVLIGHIRAKQTK